MGRQITEALMIIQSGTLNLKNEIKTNHLCRLESSKPDWDLKKERKREEIAERKLEEDIKNFVDVMSLVCNRRKCSDTKSTNPVHTSRSSKCKRGVTNEREKRETEPPDSCPKKKRRKMDSSTPLRNNGNEMLEDPDLVSPIHPAMEATTLSSVESDGGHSMAGTGRTNLSNDLRGMRIGTRMNRFNNTSSELLLEVLCLENAARGRDIMQVRERPLEWLNLEAVAIRAIADINIESWRTLSFNENDEEKSKRSMGADQGEPIPLSLIDEAAEASESIATKEEPIPPSPMAPTAPTRSTDQGEPIPLSLATSGNQAAKSVMREEEVALQTPRATTKRKLFQTPSTPTGRPRKLSTSMRESPNLLAMWETASQNNVEPAAPDLLQGIGRLTLKSQNAQCSSEDSKVSSNENDSRRIIKAGYRLRAPSPAGYRLRAPSPAGNPPVADDQNQNSNSDRVREMASAGNRLRALSLASNITPRRHQRRYRHNSVSGSSPARQLRITDIFKSQENCKANERGDDVESV